MCIRFNPNETERRYPPKIDQVINLLSCIAAGMASQTALLNRVVKMLDNDRRHNGRGEFE